MAPLETLAHAGLHIYLLPNDVLWVTPKHAITPALRVFIQQHKLELLNALNAVEWITERSAILEFDADMPRALADAQAWQLWHRRTLH
ncbi:MAG TPA: hypothetical protein VEI05_02730 [Burkholderiaceae bacterium]|nr:hypothetical protein [Burkholderiaceae bacterium]